MKKLRIILKLKYALFTFLTLFILIPSLVSAQDSNVTIQLFWAEGCPHCQDEKDFLRSYLADKPEVKLETYEINESKDNLDKLIEMSGKLGAKVNGVPFTIIGDQYINGFLVGTTEDKIISIVENRQSQIINEEGAVCTLDEVCEETEEKTGTKFNLPIIGTIDSATVSLPVLSMVIGLVDGFNPCAMWVLIFLISVLLGMKDRKRMWVLGSLFILASGLVYFLFMVAWLNLFLFLGLIVAVRIAIGALSLGVGAFNLKEFFTTKAAVCKVAGSEKKQKIFDKIKDIIHKKSFIMAAIGIVILAFAVNLVELICSAGLPAIYTQILALSDLSTWQYYSNILIYILFFMVDDLFVFFVAMFTLQLTGLTTKYTRVAKLIGGIIMLILGILLIFKPELLMFG